MKVKSVKLILSNVPIPVYDATSPEFHNLTLENGCVVHNTAKQARNQEFQAVLALRGKVINAYRAKPEKLFENEEIQNICMAIGYEDEKWNLSKLKVGRIVLLADPDIDGLHITNLLLSFFQKVMPELYDAHKIFIVDGSLYYCQFPNGTKIWGKNLQDVKQKLHDKKLKLPSQGVQRIKGWGESIQKNQILFTDQGVTKIGDYVDGKVTNVGGSKTPSFIFEKGVKETRVLKTEYNYSLEPAPTHPILVFNRKTMIMEYKKAESVKSGDYMALVVGSNVWSKNTYVFNWKGTLLEGKNNIPQCMTNDLARLLGYYVGDGCGGMVIACGRQGDASNDVEYCIKKSFPDVYISHSKSTSLEGWCFSTGTHNSSVNNFLDIIGVKGAAYTKTIPECILRSKREHVVQFLKGYFEADGHIKHSWADCYTANPELAKQIHLILLNLGIVSKLQIKNRKYNPFTGKTNNVKACRVIFRGKHLDKFVEEVGIVSREKYDQYLKSKPPKYNANKHDCLPGLGIWFRKYKTTRRQNKGQYQYLINGVWTKINFRTQSIAKELTFSCLEKHPQMEHGLRQICPEIMSTYDFTKENNIVWMKVFSNKKGLITEHFDLEMPSSNKSFKGNNYVANGFIVHNCEADVLYDVAFDKSTRKLLRITPAEGKNKGQFVKIVGDDPTARKILLGV